MLQRRVNLRYPGSFRGIFVISGRDSSRSCGGAATRSSRQWRFCSGRHRRPSLRKRSDRMFHLARRSDDVEMISLRGDFLPVQARSSCEVATNSTRRANHLPVAKTCPAPSLKIFCWSCRANHLYDSRHPVPPEGRWPSSQTRGRSRWTRQHARRSGCCVRRSREGPTPRCWRRSMVARKPVTRATTYKP